MDAIINIKNEIHKIIYSNGTTINKIINIDKLLSGETWDKDRLAKVLNLPVDCLEDYEPFELENEPKKEIVHPIKKYIAIFNKIHLEIHKRSFNFSKKEIGQLSYIIAATKENEFKEIMEYTLQMWKDKKFLDWDWKRIINKLSPTTIYHYLNFLQNCIAGKKKKKEGNEW